MEKSKNKLTDVAVGLAIIIGVAIYDFLAFALAGTVYAEAVRGNASGGYLGAMDGRDRGSGCMG